VWFHAHLLEPRNRNGAGTRSTGGEQRGDQGEGRRTPCPAKHVVWEEQVGLELKLMEIFNENFHPLAGESRLHAADFRFGTIGAHVPRQMGVNHGEGVVAQSEDEDADCTIRFVFSRMFGAVFLHVEYSGPQRFLVRPRRLYN
jgi:hypothetical protein